MLEIQPKQIECNRAPFEGAQIEQKGVSQSSNPNFFLDSTLASSGSPSQRKSCAGSVFSCLSWPFRMLGSAFTWAGGIIKTYILCCCGYSPSEPRIDWQKTRVAFAKIYDALENVTDASKREKKFEEGFREMSKTAHVRFEKHVYCAHAELVDGIADRVDQEIHVKKEKYPSKIQLSSDYYTQLDDDKKREVLQLAARNFKAEIERNT